MSRIVRHVIEIEMSGSSKKIFGSTTGKIAERAAELLVLMYEEKGHIVKRATSTHESFWRQFQNVHKLREPLKVVRRKSGLG